MNPAQLDKPHACIICNKTFEKQEALWSHRSKKHGKEIKAAKPYKCSCGSAFSREYDALRHAEKKHGGPEAEQRDVPKKQDDPVIGENQHEN